jgi:hypothetical protein
MRTASVILSLLTLPLLWLVLPVLLFPPAALWLGLVGYRRARARSGRHWRRAQQLLNALPMVLALAVGAMGWYILTTGYQA